VSEALAAWGLQASEPVLIEDEFYLWPESEPIFWLWLAVQTQWHVVDGTRLGLNYSGVAAAIELRGVSRKNRSQYFMLLQLMERTCLDEWARNR
jgi:hypothetical protein